MFGFFLPFALKIHIIKNPYIAGMEIMKFKVMVGVFQTKFVSGEKTWLGFDGFFISFDNIGAN